MGQCMEMGSLSRLKNATECGRKGPGKDNRIVGGVPVRENEIPWQVAILAQNGSWSGNNAILLSCDPVIVITAAHCVTSVSHPQDANDSIDFECLIQFVQGRKTSNQEYNLRVWCPQSKFCNTFTHGQE